MAGVNKVILIGRCGKDPEARTAGRTTVASLSIATSEKYTNKQGEKVEQTEWHNLEFWGKLADIVNQYVKKGDMIYIEGKLRTEQWQDKEGNTRYTTKVRVDQMNMLGGGNGQQAQAQPEPAGQEDDLPW